MEQGILKRIGALVVALNGQIFAPESHSDREERLKSNLMLNIGLGAIVVCPDIGRLYGSCFGGVIDEDGDRSSRGESQDLRSCAEIATASVCGPVLLPNHI